MQRLVLMVALLALGYLQYRLWFADGGVVHVRQLQAHVNERQAFNEQLLARNAALQAEVDDLRSGVAAIEGRARTDLGMVKPGETFYLLVARQD